MAQLDFVTASTTVAQGASFQVTLSGQFDASVLGAATIELEIPATGFANVVVSVAGVPVPAPQPPDATYLVEFARAAGSPGPVDLATIDCVMDGLRSGAYTMRARITDAADVDGMPLGLLTAELPVTVEPGAVGVVTGVLDDAFATAEYLQVLWAQGGQRPYTWSIAGGVLPAGIALDPAGVLSGTPLAPSVSALTLRATDQAGASGPADMTLIVHHPPLAITVTDLALAAPGRSYNQALTATGGKTPIQWQVDGLPAGLSVVGSFLAGTPQEDRSLFGLVPLTLHATDADNPPQTATLQIDLPFVPSLVLQELPLEAPGAVVVARDLCLIDYDVSATAFANRIEVSGPVGGGLDHARDALVSAIAELATEGPAVDDPGIRQQYHDSLIGLLDSYRDLGAHAQNGTSIAIELTILVDDQPVRTFNFGGQRTLKELRSRAGRPLLPYAEPRSHKARLIREAFDSGGARLRAWARGVLDAAFDDFQSHAKRQPRREFSGDPGPGGIGYGLMHLLPWLEGTGVDIGRWFRGLFPALGRIPLTPGRHRITVRWDGGHVVQLLGGIVVSVGGGSDLVNFTATFQPVTHSDWPRFSSPTIVQGHQLGLPGSRDFDVELSSSGLDIVACSGDGMKLFVDTGDPQVPYASAVAYPVQPAFEPERITSAVLDPYGRTSLLLHSAHTSAVVLNDGPAGLKLMRAGHVATSRERVFAMTRGPREPSGWRSLHVSLGTRMLSYHGLRGLLAALPDPQVEPLESAIRLDDATCLSLVEAEEATPAFLAAGFGADGRVAALGQSSDLVAPGEFQQPADMVLGQWTGGGTELAVALRQAKEVRLFRWATGSWTALAPIPLQLRPWSLCEGPSNSPCLAVASTHFGSVLLIVWPEPDQPPKVLHLYRGGAGIQIGGAGGTLAVADPAGGTLLVYR